MEFLRFLKARLDEDDERAQRAAELWNDEDWRPEWEDLPDEVFAHARNHDPARVLREVEAKRRIIELHPHGYWPRRKGKPHLYCETCDEEDGVIGGDGLFCPTLRFLALPYADHPAYRAEWKP
jgi:uncharacterized protein DUF6221